MSTLPSARKEMAALLKLMKGDNARQTQESTDLGITLLPTTDFHSEKMSFAVCLYYRGGRTLVPGNILAECWDCKLPIQYRPDLPQDLPKCCAICSLKRTECGS